MCLATRRPLALWFFTIVFASRAVHQTLSRLRIDGAWMGNFHHRALMVFASVSAYTAPALMTVCLFTNYWIYGKQTRLSTNPVVKAGDTRAVNFTYHRIGLWRECMRESMDIPYDCKNVKYSKAEAKLEKGFKAVSCKSCH